MPRPPALSQPVLFGKAFKLRRGIHTLGAISTRGTTFIIISPTPINFDTPDCTARGATIDVRSRSLRSVVRRVNVNAPVSHLSWHYMRRTGVEHTCSIRRTGASSITYDAGASSRVESHPPSRCSNRETSAYAAAGHKGVACSHELPCTRATISSLINNMASDPRNHLGCYMLFRRTYVVERSSRLGPPTRTPLNPNAAILAPTRRPRDYLATLAPHAPTHVARRPRSRPGRQPQPPTATHSSSSRVSPPRRASANQITAGQGRRVLIRLALLVRAVAVLARLPALQVGPHSHGHGMK